MTLLTENGLRAYFSIRRTGNVSFSHGSGSDVVDNRFDVSTNNRFSLFATKGKKTIPHGFAPKLEHGDRIIVIRREETALYDGKGILSPGDIRCDAIVTDAPGFPFIFEYGDCPLVILHDSREKVFSVFHSGRRGTFLNLAEKTVAEMRMEFGCDSKNIKAHFSPRICRLCYRQKYKSWELPPEDLLGFSVAHMNGEISLDLTGMIIHQLGKSGIVNMDFRQCDCTCHALLRGEGKYFSHFGHRRNFAGHEENGRNALFVEMES